MVEELINLLNSYGNSLSMMSNSKKIIALWPVPFRAESDSIESNPWRIVCSVTLCVYSELIEGNRITRCLEKNEVEIFKPIIFTFDQSFEETLVVIDIVDCVEANTSFHAYPQTLRLKYDSLMGVSEADSSVEIALVSTDRQSKGTEAVESPLHVPILLSKTELPLLKSWESSATLTGQIFPYERQFRPDFLNQLEHTRLGRFSSTILGQKIDPALRRSTVCFMWVFLMATIYFFYPRTVQRILHRAMVTISLLWRMIKSTFD